MDQDVKFPGYGLLNRSPKIISVYWYIEDCFPAINAISQRLSDEPVIFLVTTAWSIVDRWRTNEFRKLLASAENHRVTYPRHHVVFLGNDAIETGMMRQLGLSSIEFNRNGFLNISKFNEWRAVKSVSVEYDAVYTARIQPYKRIELMENIGRSALISAASNKEYYNNIKFRLKNVTLVNGSPETGEVVPLSHARTYDVVKQSKVGLCLSAIEGAMIASVEYMLLGLPVVSTPSLGGRDAFFDREYTTICEPNSAAVAKAVSDLVARGINPEFIYQKTTSHISTIRVRLMEYILDNYTYCDSDFSLLSDLMLSERTGFEWKEWFLRDIYASE